MINESFLNEWTEGGNVVTGEDVASFLGPEALELYKKGKQENAIGNQMKEDKIDFFKNFMQRLNEVDKKNTLTPIL